MSPRVSRLGIFVCNLFIGLIFLAPVAIWLITLNIKSFQEMKAHEYHKWRDNRQIGLGILWALVCPSISLSWVAVFPRIPKVDFGQRKGLSEVPLTDIGFLGLRMLSGARQAMYLWIVCGGRCLSSRVTALLDGHGCPQDQLFSFRPCCIIGKLPARWTSPESSTHFDPSGWRRSTQEPKAQRKHVVRQRSAPDRSSSFTSPGLWNETGPDVEDVLASYYDEDMVPPQSTARLPDDLQTPIVVQSSEPRLQDTVSPSRALRPGSVPDSLRAIPEITSPEANPSATATDSEAQQLINPPSVVPPLHNTHRTNTGNASGSPAEVINTPRPPLKRRYSSVEVSGITTSEGDACAAEVGTIGSTMGSTMGSAKGSTLGSTMGSAMDGTTGSRTTGSRTTGSRTTGSTTGSTIGSTIGSTTTGSTMGSAMDSAMDSTTTSRTTAGSTMGSAMDRTTTGRTITGKTTTGRTITGKTTTGSAIGGAIDSTTTGSAMDNMTGSTLGSTMGSTTGSIKGLPSSPEQHHPNTHQPHSLQNTNQPHSLQNTNQSHSRINPIRRLILESSPARCWWETRDGLRYWLRWW